MPSDTATPHPGSVAASLATSLLALGPGPLARLRRMDVRGPGVPDYWMLAARHALLGHGQEEAWMQVVKILALLAPKGDPHNRKPFHDNDRPLGKALCDGGDKSWQPQSTDGRPILSEARFARFLALPFAQRGEALERLARWLSARRASHSGLDCGDIAWLLFDPGPKPIRSLAKSYYGRLDYQPATATAQEETTP